MMNSPSGIFARLVASPLPIRKEGENEEEEEEGEREKGGREKKKKKKKVEICLGKKGEKNRQRRGETDTTFRSKVERGSL